MKGAELIKPQCLDGDGRPLPNIEAGRVPVQITIVKGSRVPVQITSNAAGNVLATPRREVVTAAASPYLQDNRPCLDFDKNGVVHVAEYDFEHEEWIECLP